jgi:hypothetical protein
MDVSNSVDVTDVAAVGHAVRKIFGERYPGFDFAPIETLLTGFERLYAGTLPGFRGCDIHYHNDHHVLDVTLAMARLIDGHDASHSGPEQLGPDLALKGIATALFHDSGYIRRTRDTRQKNGAAYTHIHVSRSARFMAEYFPQVGLDHLVPTCSTIVYFTSYLLDPATIDVASARERRLGELLGTADLIAQMSDVEYLHKLRNHLYAEFEAGGMAGDKAYRTHTGFIYDSPRHLLELTPDFIRNSIELRLEGYFGGAFRYAAKHFGGPDLYMDAIVENSNKLEALLAESE